MKDHILEPERLTPVRFRCRTAVVGGGFAGIAAALSAARAGADVILLEQQYALGGLATLGLITHYLPLCDGYGHQVSFSLAEELMLLSVSLDEEPDVLGNWRAGISQSAPETAKRLICEFNPALFAILAEKLLLSAGVRILYGAGVCGVSMQDGAVSELVVESREGRWAVEVKNVVDCTGDAIVCAQAGVELKLFAQKNILAAWYGATNNGVYRVIPLGACDIPEEYKTEEQRRTDQTRKKRYVGIGVEDLSAFTIDGHALLLQDYLRKGPPDDSHRLATIPTIPEVRMTRKLVGAVQLDENTEAAFDDSIGLFSNWKRRGPVYEIPFSSMYSNRVSNLVTAGRCISVSDTMWDNTRVIPPCVVTGEAAGLAAAMFDDFHTVQISKLQAVLRQRGVVLHKHELYGQV